MTQTKTQLTDEELEKRFPELHKLSKVPNHEIATIQDFMDWAGESGYRMCTVTETPFRDHFEPVLHGGIVNQYLKDVYDIDQEKVDDERNEMLDAIRNGEFS